MILHAGQSRQKEQKRKRTSKDRSVARFSIRERLLFARGGRNVGVFLLKTLDAAGGVYEFLLAGEERVATRADFDAEHISFDGRARLESMAASAMYGYGMVVGVDTGFHDSPFCRGRSARVAQPG